MSLADFEVRDDDLGNIVGGTSKQNNLGYPFICTNPNCSAYNKMVYHARQDDTVCETCHGSIMSAKVTGRELTKVPGTIQVDPKGSILC